MPKNIIILSDGTGQEGGKGHDTNVYKLFRMLEDRTEREVVEALLLCREHRLPTSIKSVVTNLNRGELAGLALTGARLGAAEHAFVCSRRGKRAVGSRRCAAGSPRRSTPRSATASRAPSRSSSPR